MPTNDKDAINLALGLFYSNNGILLPKIYEKLFNVGATLQTLQKHKKLCTDLAKRIESLTIHKYNTIEKNQYGFQLTLVQNIKYAEFICDKLLKLAEPSTENLNQMLNVALNDVEQIYQLLKGSLSTANINEDSLTLCKNPANSRQGQFSQGGIFATSGYNVLSDGGPSADKLATKYSTAGDSKIFAAGINSANEVLAGVGWALNRAASSSLSNHTQQQIGIYKQYLLLLLDKCMRSGIRPTHHEIKLINKFMNIKRGNILENLTTRKTNSYQEFQRILNKNTSDHERENSSLIEIKGQIKNHLKFKQYDKIQPLLSSDSAKLGNIVFKVNGFRGRLQDHFLINKVDFPLISTQPQNDNPTYLQLYRELKSYRPKDKIGASRYISEKVALILASNFSVAEKKELLQLIQRELAKKDEGNFYLTRVKRFTLIQEIFIGTLGYQGLNLKRDTLAIANECTTDKQLMSYLGIAGATLGWVGFSTLVPLSGYFSAGNTTTYSSLARLVAAALQSCSLGASSTVNAPFITGGFASFPMSESVASFQTVSEYKNQILQYVKTNNLESIITLLSIVSDKKLLYCILTEDYEGTFLLDHLFTVSLKPGDENTAVLSDLIKLFKLAVGSVTKAYEYTSLSKFRKYIAKTLPASANDALLQYYIVLAGISQITDKTVKSECLEYFAGIIMRVKDDPSSQWYNLRKSTKSRELMLRTLTRVSGAILWGTISTGLVSLSLLAPPYLIPTLLLIDGLRGVLYGASNNFTHHNTQQYQTISKQLSNTKLHQALHYERESTAQEAQKILSQKKSSVHCQEIFKAIQKTKKGQAVTIDDFKFLTRDNQLLNQFNNMRIGVSSSTEIIVNDNNLPEWLPSLELLIGEITAEVADKYTANEALYRIVTIILHSNHASVKKNQMLDFVERAFRDRILKIAQLASFERSFAAKRKYFIPDFLFGMLAATTTVSGLTPLAEYYQTLFGGAGDVAGTLLLLFGLNQDQYYIDTKSYTDSLEFLRISKSCAAQLNEPLVNRS